MAETSKPSPEVLVQQDSSPRKLATKTEEQVINEAEAAIAEIALGQQD